MQLQTFSKIFALGHRTHARLYEGNVEITEKVDGSQFGFGKIDGEAVARSKGRMLVLDACDSMFTQAAGQVQRIVHLLPDNVVFWGEYMNKPKHNLIAYETTPKNNIMLFGMHKDQRDWLYTRDELEHWAALFGFDVAPVLYQGPGTKLNAVFISDLLDTDSYLGGSKIEGVVLKNWEQHALIGDQYLWPLAGKLVSDRFKEKMGQKKNKFSSKGRWEDYKQAFRTDARWHKAIQHLKEDGLLLGEPKDIGPLIKEINRDIVAEHKDEIMIFLWSQFGKDILRAATAGFPQWYKEQLMEQSFEEPVAGYTKESWNEMVDQAESNEEFVKATQGDKE